jgi:hypothetical protein
MKSYSADEMRDEDKVVSLRIRTKSGKKFRLYATSDICNTQSMTELCRDFERAAKDQNVESKFLSW